MPSSVFDLRQAVESLLLDWETGGMPSRETLMEQAAALCLQRGDRGLWEPAPTMLTATIDDGIGQGIDLIGRFAAAVGMQVTCAGLLLSPARILEEARRACADLVGLTVLQLDSEPELAAVARGLAPRTMLVAGGPAFRLDAEMAERAGVGFVAASVVDFLGFLLGYQPGRRQPA
ncbi:MAG: cobalamin B12-binding domain-containing protein [Desulfobacterales bacterium]|jgi:methylmalonyl-CoA mutase cobalamin-binding subunit